MTQKEFQKKFGGEIVGGWLVFSGGLDCSNNQLTSLPENLKVGGGLYCYNNKLTSLPENLKVDGGLYCSNNQLKKVPDYIKNIKYCYIFEGIKWNDPIWINKILADELTAEEVFAIDNIEHRRIAYQYMDKLKMKELKDYKILDEKIDDKGNPMKIVSFTIQNMKEPLKFYNCFCPSTMREYFLQTEKDTCLEAKNSEFGFVGEVEWVNEW